MFRPQVDPASALTRARSAAGLTQRELARRAGTSQAAISAYEAGRKDPSARTLARLLAACGHRLAVTEVPGHTTPDEFARRGRHLADVLALAEALPFRRPGSLRYPRLPT